MLIMAATTFFISYLAVVATPYPAPMLRRSMNEPKFEGWRYNAFAGVVTRWRVHGRDLEKTSSTSTVTFESIDSIPSSQVHFPSATSRTPSISIAAHDFAQYFSSYDDSLISQDSSIDDSADYSSSSTDLPLPTSVGPGILGLTRKEAGDPFDSFGLVYINRSSRAYPSSDDEISNTILHEAALTFLEPSACFETDDSRDSEPVDMSSPQNRPRRSLTRNFSASTVSSSLKRASKTGASYRGRSWR